MQTPPINLKERIAALQQRNVSPSQHPSTQIASKGIPIAGTGALRDKIAKFEKKGGIPVPRGSFGMGVPCSADPQAAKKRGELYGNRIQGLGRPSGPPVSRTGSPLPLNGDLPGPRKRCVSTGGALSRSPITFRTDDAIPPVPNSATPPTPRRNSLAVDFGPGRRVVSVGGAESLSEGAALPSSSPVPCPPQLESDNPAAVPSPSADSLYLSSEAPEPEVDADTIGPIQQAVGMEENDVKEEAALNMDETQSPCVSSDATPIPPPVHIVSSDSQQDTVVDIPVTKESTLPEQEVIPQPTPPQLSPALPNPPLESPLQSSDATSHNTVPPATEEEEEEIVVAMLESTHSSPVESDPITKSPLPSPATTLRNVASLATEVVDEIVVATPESAHSPPVESDFIAESPLPSPALTLQNASSLATEEVEEEIIVTTPESTQSPPVESDSIAESPLPSPAITLQNASSLATEVEERGDESNSGPSQRPDPLLAAPLPEEQSAETVLITVTGSDVPNRAGPPSPDLRPTAPPLQNKSTFKAVVHRKVTETPAATAPVSSLIAPPTPQVVRSRRSPGVTVIDVTSSAGPGELTILLEEAALLELKLTEGNTSEILDTSSARTPTSATFQSVDSRSVSATTLTDKPPSTPDVNIPSRLSLCIPAIREPMLESEIQEIPEEDETSDGRSLASTTFSQRSPSHRKYLSGFRRLTGRRSSTNMPGAYPRDSISLSSEDSASVATPPDSLSGRSGGFIAWPSASPKKQGPVGRASSFTDKLFNRNRTRSNVSTADTGTVYHRRFL